MNSFENNVLYNFGPFTLNASSRRLYRDGETVRVPRIAYDLLVLLVKSAGELKNRETLIKTLWPDTIVEENSLSWYVSVLRKALGDEDKPSRYIETVRGQGYRFIAPISTKTEGPSPSTSRRRRARARATFALLAAAFIVMGVVIWQVLVPRPGDNTAAHAPNRSVAVLPFENLSANRGNAYFVAGIQDTILTKLSGIADLRVISRTSTAQYPSHPQNLRKVARQLGVGSVLEGSVQKAGDRVLINVQLIDVRNNSHIWAKAYTRNLDNIFAVESDVAEQVAAALKAKLLPEEKARVVRAPTQNPQAYDLYLKAEYLASKVERGSANANVMQARQAAELYRRAIALDPGFALAHARLSYLDIYVYWFGIYRFDRASRPEQLAAARHQAQQALAADIPQAHLAMGYVYYWGYHSYTKALAQFDQVRRILPNNAEAIGAIALIHRRQGKWKAALAGLQQAQALDPRNPRWYYELGATHAQMRDYPKAVEQFEHALAIDPDNHRAAAYKALAQLLMGRPSEAQKTLAITPNDPEMKTFFGVLRFEAARLRRQTDESLNSLAVIHTPWVEAAFAIGNIPTAFLKAQAWSLNDKPRTARIQYEKARTQLTAALRKTPNDATLLSTLGVVQANLGNKAEALRAARRAVELRPRSLDALAGPSYAVKLAATYARLGESAEAIKLLEQQLAIPAGLFISVPLLKCDPTWDPLRDDPAFRALLEKYGSTSCQ